MSFILDALRKSEIERQRQSGPSIAEIPIAREDRRLPVALIAIGVLLAVNVGVLLFFLLRDGGAAEPEAAAPVAAANAPTAVPAPVSEKLLLASLLSATPGCAAPSRPSLPVIGQKATPTPLAQEIKDIDPTPSTAVLAKQETYLLDLQTFKKKLAASSRAETPKSKP